MSDQELLRDYTEHRSEAAFAELVRRHVDLVYSAALRMVCDAHLAEDVTQGVFLALSQNAHRLKDRPVLSGWLHRTAQNLSANTVRSDVRRRAREQEATLMNEILSDNSDTRWEEIAPHLDDALCELNEPDRDALLLRFFERKSAKEMAQILDTSEVAAQKRVNRAMGHLRHYFVKHGVTVGASGLVTAISANAIQSAPIGLAATISIAAASAGITIGTTAAISKSIAMTLLQKTLFTGTLAIAVGTGIYETHQSWTLQSQVQALQQAQSPLTEQVKQLMQERDTATNALALLQGETERVQKERAELLSLRGEVGLLRRQTNELARMVSKARAPISPAAQSNNSIPSTNNSPAEMNIPKESWAFSGFTTPEAALQSWAWAMNAGNLRVILDSFTEEAQIEFKKQLAGKSDNEIAAFIQQEMSQISGLRLDSKKVSDDGRVAFTLITKEQDNGSVKTRDEAVVHFKKVGAVWKISED